MNKLAICLPFIAVAALVGCAAPEEPRPVAPVTSSGGAPVTSSSGAPVVSSATAPRTVVVVPAAVLRAGTGVVDSVSAVPTLGAASAGASQPSGASRLGIRMSDGTMQFVDYAGRDISVGQRIELTSDGFIRKI
jgi:hypothetical protein